MQGLKCIHEEKSTLECHVILVVEVNSSFLFVRRVNGTRRLVVKMLFEIVVP